MHVKIVTLNVSFLPKDKPCYLIAVNYATDLVVYMGLGCDMLDCIFPVWAVCFGSALFLSGSL